MALLDIFIVCFVDLDNSLPSNSFLVLCRWIPALQNRLEKEIMIFRLIQSSQESLQHSKGMKKLSNGKTLDQKSLNYHL